MPTGSRRTIEVCPGRYSPAVGACRLRMAPAKKRQQSMMAGSSSFFTALIGLPQLSASRLAKSSAFFSIASAIFSR
ncbi:hypothetical protein D3C87_1754360 [compost metagenome]